MLYGSYERLLWKDYGVLCYSSRAYWYMQYMRQQMHSIKNSKIQIINYSSLQASDSTCFDIELIP